ncbi:hypothetical protein C8Q78DRAFT_1032030 [Trametes maxima]|nr:hypothetical protein C8Q78DRAFT_1032030 [Trametes maxima]
MDGRPPQPIEKELPPLPPQRPPLITPSLSPPGSRIFRIPDRPPPPKRPRLSSTPSSSASTRLSSQPPRDLRLESSSRLFAFWDQLAERYNKPLDEDDIVDLGALDFLKDRGVTRSAARTYDIGSFADGDDGSSQAAEDEVESSAAEDNAPEDDSSDELDLISPPSPVQQKLQYYRNWYVPPANDQDPEDAEAFREFEEAEKRRKELYGDEDEDEDGGGVLGAGTDNDDVGESEFEEDVADEKDDAPLDPTQDGVWDGGTGSSPSRRLKPQRRKSRPPPLPGDDLSEDEFATWDIDDTPIPPRRSVPPPGDIIDLTISRSPSPVLPPRDRSQSHQRTQARAPSRARSQSQPRTRAKSKPSAGESPVNPLRSPSSEQVLQLLTPPHSSCSAPEMLPSLEKAPVRAETPSPKMPRPRARYVPKPQSLDERGGYGRSTSHSPSRTTSPTPATPQRAVKRVSRGRMKLEVVITTPRMGSRRPKTPAPQDSPDIPQSTSSRAPQQINATEDIVLRSSKSKGKGVERRPSTPEAPSAPSYSRRTNRSARDLSEDSCSTQPKPARGRKRRRVSSFSSSDGSLGQVDATSSPMSALASSRKPKPSASGRPGYSSDVAPPTSSPVRSDEEDESSPVRSVRSISRARSEASIPCPPLYPHIYPPFTPQRDRRAVGDDRQEQHSHHPTHHPYPQMSLQHSQAMAWMSYFMASGVLPPPPPLPPSDSGFNSGPPFSFYAPPFTPSHRGRSYQQPAFTPSTSDAGPSRSPTYSTPTHYPHSYPYWFNAAYSSGTLPPSSPIPSSPVNSSPVLRPASVPPGQRSQARGRRVSFKLDVNDRPLAATPPRHHGSIEGPNGALESDEEESRSRGRSRQRNASSKPTKGKGKSKARAVSPSDEAEENGQQTAGKVVLDRGQPLPRARTPGPPPQRAQSAPRGSATGKGTAPAKK